MILLLISLQIIDITVHVLSDQIEPLRILANALVIIWFIQIYKYKSKNLGYLVTTIYLGLNTLFLVLNGLSNNGEPRIFFWISISLTVLISILITNKKD
mgnify:CR=1 FL=1|tara:strand:+ start:781 stop:1077 length:297 start_codon:yes stop_codon:yes gene_type:complete